MLLRGCAALLASILILVSAAAAQPSLTLQPHDRIALVGNSLADRMRLFGHFETRLHLAFPEHELAIRNFGWPAD